MFPTVRLYLFGPLVIIFSLLLLASLKLGGPIVKKDWAAGFLKGFFK